MRTRLRGGTPLEGGGDLTLRTGRHLASILRTYRSGRRWASDLSGRRSPTETGSRRLSPPTATATSYARRPTAGLASAWTPPKGCAGTGRDSASRKRHAGDHGRPMWNRQGTNEPAIARQVRHAMGMKRSRVEEEAQMTGRCIRWPQLDRRAGATEIVRARNGRKDSACTGRHRRAVCNAKAGRLRRDDHESREDRSEGWSRDSSSF
jgi:hypothetical protein